MNGFLLKRVGKTITSEEIQSLQKQHLGSGFNENKFYKLIYNLKNKGYLIELKSGLYVISYPEAQNRTMEDIKEAYYRPLLHQLIKAQYGSSYYIGGKKGLELHLNNYEIPDDIDITVTNGASKKHTVLSDTFASCRTIVYNHPHKSQKQIEKIIRSKTTKILLANKSFLIGPIELCLLETLYYQGKGGGGYEMELTKRVLKKYKSKLDTDLIITIIQSGKYHTSLNRLYQAAKSIDSSFATQLFNIIKTHGFRIAV